MLLYHTIVHEEKMDHYPYGFKSVDSGENTGKKWFKCSRRSIQRHFENSWLTQGTTKRSSIGTHASKLLAQRRRHFLPEQVRVQLLLLPSNQNSSTVSHAKSATGKRFLSLP